MSVRYCFICRGKGCTKCRQSGVLIEESSVGSGCVGLATLIIFYMILLGVCLPPLMDYWRNTCPSEKYKVTCTILNNIGIKGEKQ